MRGRGRRRIGAMKKGGERKPSPSVAPSLKKRRRITTGNKVKVNHPSNQLTTQAQSRNQDDAKLAHIFPDEIWKQVLDKLNDNTKTRLNSGIPFFRRLLLPDRTLFLFPAVLNVMYLKLEAFCYEEAMRKYKQAEEEWMNGMEGDEEDEEGTDIPEPGPTMLLNLRQVCRKWCEGVDGALQEKSLHRQIVRNNLHGEDYLLSTGLSQRDDEDSDLLLQWMERHDGYEMMETTDNLSKFLTHFGGSYLESGRNPFLARNLYLELHEETPDEEILNVSQALESFGGHIWCCTLRTSSIRAGTARDWLAMMPNLRQLHWQTEFARTERPDETDAVEEELDRQPFPKLTSLMCVRFGVVPTWIVRSFMKKNNHIQVFQPPPSLDFNLQNESLLAFNVGVRLPNLTQLSIQMDWKHEDLFAKLEKCKQKWLLTKFELKFTDDKVPMEEEYIEWKRVFKLLQKWRNSLTDVMLEAPYEFRSVHPAGFVWDPEVKLEINLPKLKRLCLKSLIVDLPNLFLPLYDSLETLVFFNMNVFLSKLKPRPQAKIRPRDPKIPPYDSYGWSDMDASNIWQVFPKLKRVEFLERGAFIISSRV